MPANVYRFIEHWTIPGFSPEEAYAVVADSRLITRACLAARGAQAEERG